VSLRYPERVAAIVRRELRAFRLEHTLTSTLNVAQDYRQKLQSVLRTSKDAIAQVQEGILVEVNASWLELFQLQNDSTLVGQPVMDCFNSDTHAPLRGALSACARGRWSDLPLKAQAILADKSVAPIELTLSIGEYDGEPSVQLMVPARRRDDQQLANELAAAVRQDSATGLWMRRYLLELMRAALQQPIPGGTRYLAAIRPDRMAEIEGDVGPENADDLLTQLAATIKAHCGPTDALGHLGGISFGLLAERGSRSDMEAWCASLIEKVSRTSYVVGTRTIQIHCSIGTTQVPNTSADLGGCLTLAQDALRRAIDRGGNQTQADAENNHSSRMLAYDEVWVRHIRAALEEKRFRLVQQPIASLTGNAKRVFDVTVRMLDFQGKDVLPSEFLPPAKRNNLLAQIDHWVLGAAVAMSREKHSELLFIRLSGDSITHLQTATIVKDLLTASKADPSRLCLQFTEADALKYRTQLMSLCKRLQTLGVKLAIQHFGVQPEAPALLSALPLNYIKIDGSLMQGLASDVAMQSQVRDIVVAANRMKIGTVAEQVEDANTMAVVFQLGVQYIQGYLVHKPEEVVLGS
jgi:EAL domain-containing protein (putative c-di-GMP-specific phosphodiesterase class I)/GGDEF domain-containing protein